MELNADFSQRVVVHSASLKWVASPMPGVDRRMLDRIGDEVARATSIVRYAPGSHFSSHVHTGGEEFLVLDGVFQDEHGDFPAGSYIRNPPTSSHTPGSSPGCTIFVKLWQFDPADRTPVMIDTNKMGSVRSADRPGVAVMPLFEDERESVQIEHWQPDASVTIDAAEGAEILILDGEFELKFESKFEPKGGESLKQHAWLRLPIGSKATVVAGNAGARVWTKYRHLRFVEPPKV